MRDKEQLLAEMIEMTKSYEPGHPAIAAWAGLLEPEEREIILGWFEEKKAVLSQATLQIQALLRETALLSTEILFAFLYPGEADHEG